MAAAIGQTASRGGIQVPAGTMLKAVMIDSREPEPIQRLTFGGVPAVVTALDAGDLWATCDDGELLIIERKTTSDLLASISDNRLFLQAQKIRAISPWAYVVVTGHMQPTHDNKTYVNGKLTGWNWNAIQGALLDVQEAGVHIVYTDHDNGYEAAVQRLADRRRGERVLNTTPAVKSRVISPAEQILTALPGIGLERAQDVLNTFDGNAAQALCWLTWPDTFGEVAGIDNGIKMNVRRALQLREGETLTVWSDEAAANMKQTMREEIVTDIARNMDRVKELVTA